MKKTFIVVLAGAFLIQAAFTAQACDMCAVFRAQQVGKSTVGLNLSIAEQYTHFGTIRQDGTKVDNAANQKLESSITQFVPSYQITDRFGVQLSAPFIYRSYRRVEAGAIEKGTEQGLGDISLIGYGRLYEFMNLKVMFAWDVMGGVKFPTGDSDRLGEELNETEPVPGVPESAVHGHDLALGSGSYDGLVGTGIVFAWQRLFCSGAVQYSIRTEGDFDYQCANDVMWNVKPGAYLWLDKKGSVALKCVVQGEKKGRDTFLGEKTEDTGIETILVGPELDFTWQDELSAAAGMAFPTSTDNTALQLVPDHKIYAALTWRL
ncbi:MAG: hypothetical protein C0404_00645 [Verrucomicrobia bacterium]|nr:hypothetical protein [Verrucomicrobiota bacterium]